MRKIIDCLKSIAKTANDLWIRSVGGEIRIFGNPRIPEGSIVYGLYEFPHRSQLVHGIDSTDEMTIQLELSALGRACVVDGLIGKKLIILEDDTELVETGEKPTIVKKMWEVVDWYRLHHPLLGIYRMVLIVRRCKEDRKIHLQTSYGTHVEMNDDSQNGY